MLKRFICVLGLLLPLMSSPVVLADNLLQLDIVAKKRAGQVVIRLLPDVAPKHIERIKALVNEGAYDNMVFHRVIPGFMAQTGDVKYGKRDSYDAQRVGTGGSDLTDLYAELSEIPFEAGIVGMARNRYIHSANSQFFIMTAHHPSLNGKYTVIGVVVEGLDLVRELAAGSSAKEQGKVTDPDYIRKASLVAGQ